MLSFPFKKLLCLAVSMLALGLSGCGKSDVRPQNYVAPGALSADQEELIKLITVEEERISIFEVKTKDIYSSVSFWVETYSFGELTESREAILELRFDPAETLSGKLVAIENRTPELRWSLIYGERGGTKVVAQSDPAPAFETTGRAFCALEKSIEIVDGEEIVLLVALYNNSRSFDTIDTQSFLDANSLNQYAHAQLVKCRFLQ